MSLTRNIPGFFFGWGIRHPPPLEKYVYIKKAGGLEGGILLTKLYFVIFFLDFFCADFGEKKNVNKKSLIRII